MPSSISKTDLAQVKRDIAARAEAEGFDSVGFARAVAAPQAAKHLREYLAKGHHASMGWMEGTVERRADPQKLWGDVSTIITLGMNYAPNHDPLEALTRRDTGAISVYAQGADYHDVILRKLKSLAAWLVATHGGDAKVFVDTAPVMEKPLSQMSGLGWQGKHTNLVSRDFGSWLFLGSVFTTLTLPPDEPETDHCGACRNCLDVCPTSAFPTPYRIDARRCISYLTIEHKGHIAPEFREAMGNRIYGCDDCLSVCPWNKFAKDSRAMAFAPRPTLVGPRLAELAALTDEGFRALFAKSPVKRIKRDRFVRNVLIAIGNSGDPDLAASASALMDDASPLVRAMAAWALCRLLPKQDFARLAAQRRDLESDAEVAAEWTINP